MNDIPLLSDDIQTMMINRVRYCLKQHTSVLACGKHPSIIASHICNLKISWGKLSDDTKSIIKNDITQHINDIQDKLKNYDLFGPRKSVLRTVLEYWEELHNWMNANA